MIRTELIAPLAELLERQARARGDSPAYSDARRQVTWAELARQVTNLAAALKRGGLADGSAVAIWLPNGVDWVIACLAAVRAGGIAVPIPADASPSEAAYRIEDSAAAVVICTPARDPVWDEITAGSPTPPRRIAPGAAPGGPAEDFAALCETPAGDTPLPPDDIEACGYIIYTSGTTGRPKGVKLCTRAILWVTAACWTPITGYGPEDRVLSPLPLFHSFALSISVLSPLATGASIHLMERFSSQGALELLKSGRFTFMPGVPTMYHYLLLAAEAEGNGDTTPLPNMRMCISAGAIMQASLGEKFRERFGVELADSYGITEMSTMVTMAWPGHPAPPGSCGLPVLGMALRIVDAEDRDLPFGEEGELICRAPNLMLGYHNMAEQTEATLRGGWYRTGDLARFDKAGFLYITGRLKELIIRGGQNIAPAEVEECLMLAPGVQDCAVAGAPHDTLGEVPVGYVVPRPGQPLDADALRAHCAARLSAYKVPARFVEVTDIPRTGSGKVMRFRLAEKAV